MYVSRFQQYFFKYRSIPTLEECGEVIGVSSKSTVHNFFQQMLEHGYLRRGEGRYYPGDRLMSIPFFESVKAWFPATATDEVKEDIRLEEYLIEDPLKTIFVKVSGDSMIQAGIQDGDALIVEKEAPYKQGDIVVAVVDGEYTVKYLNKDANGFYLRAGNPNYKDIRPEVSMEIFGVVKGSFRKYA